MSDKETFEKVDAKKEKRKARAEKIRNAKALIRANYEVLTSAVEEDVLEAIKVLAGTGERAAGKGRRHPRVASVAARTSQTSGVVQPCQRRRTHSD